MACPTALSLAEIFPDIPFDQIVDVTRRYAEDFEQSMQFLLQKSEQNSQPDLISFDETPYVPQPLPHFSEPKTDSIDGIESINDLEESFSEDVNQICQLFPGIPSFAVQAILDECEGDYDRAIDLLLREKEKDNLRISGEIPNYSDEESISSQQDLDDMSHLGNVFDAIFSRSSSNASRPMDMSALEDDEALARALEEDERQDYERVKRHREQEDSTFALLLAEEEETKSHQEQQRRRMVGQDEDLAKKMAEEEEGLINKMKLDIVSATDQEIARLLAQDWPIDSPSTIDDAQIASQLQEEEAAQQRHSRHPPVHHPPVAPRIEVPEIDDTGARSYMRDFSKKLRAYQLPKLFNGKVTIDKVVSQQLLDAFEQKWAEITAKYPDDFHNVEPTIAFHGTAAANIPNIVRIGLVVPGSHGVQHATDTGFYGKGIYLSPNPGLSIGYCRGSGKLLVCAVLMGRRLKLKAMCQGAALRKGFDSHVSPDGNEFVLFQASQVLPLFVINFTSASGQQGPSHDTYPYEDISEPGLLPAVPALPAVPWWGHIAAVKKKKPKKNYAHRR
eukprot:TRINITY_DN2962_c0_g1_i1.p1 TRINITY_DN2962_c0_g1~~TRINITY_DN2962_c0_g1_i1.p1  ORF type:complete len:560 (+),score=137.88 TRINITY_DN2962_c0_g1_i1:29-1708(+)